MEEMNEEELSNGNGNGITFDMNNNCTVEMGDSILDSYGNCLFLNCFLTNLPFFQREWKNMSQKDQSIFKLHLDLTIFNFTQYLQHQELQNTSLSGVETRPLKRSRTVSLTPLSDTSFASPSNLEVNSINNNFIFLKIPVPIWSNIFQTLSEGLQHRTLANLRLTCKLFRKLISPFWKQKISNCHLECYLHDCKRLDFYPECISVNEKNIFEPFQLFPPQIKELQIHCIIKDDDLKYIPPTLQKLTFKSPNSLTNDAIKYLPPSLTEINFGQCFIDAYGIQHLPPNTRLRYKLYSEDLTPLICCIMESNFQLVKHLIEEKGVSVNQSNSDGKTALHFACKSNRLEIARYLINKGANINQGTFRDNMTPLYASCFSGHFDIITLLVEHGVDINKACTDDGSTPLFIASYRGHKNIVSFLLQNGANVNQARSNDGATPIFVASQEGYLEVVEILCRAGGDVKQGNFQDGWQAIHIASQEDRPEIVEYLIQNGANVNQPTLDDGSTPLFFAARDGKLRVVQVLIKYRADVNQARTDTGSTPLHIACRENHLKIIDFLLSNGADINKRRTDTGSTPLHIACRENNLDIVKILIERGASLNVERTDTGSSPLHMAVKNGDLDLVKYLVEKGANVNQFRPKDKLSALHFGILENKPDIMEFLLLNGSEVNTVCLYDLPNSKQIMEEKNLTFNPSNSYTALYFTYFVGSIGSLSLDSIISSSAQQEKSPLQVLLQFRPDIDLTIQLSEQNGHFAVSQFFKELKLILKK